MYPKKKEAATKPGQCNFLQINSVLLLGICLCKCDFRRQHTVYKYVLYVLHTHAHCPSGESKQKLLLLQSYGKTNGEGDV